MRRRVFRSLVAATLVGALCASLYEAATQVGRGRLFGEPFYDGRPASFWAREIEQWTTQDPDWCSVRVYTHRSYVPRWFAGLLPEAPWPRLLDGDPDARAVLCALSQYPSAEVQDWARIGIERIDNGQRGPCKPTRPDVIFTAELFEVDEAFYKKVAQGTWRSLAELEELEQAFLEKRTGASLLDTLDRYVVLARVNDKKIQDTGETLVLSLTKQSTCLPSPSELRRGRHERQTIQEGVCLHAQVQVSSDRRFVRVKLIEKTVEIEGIDTVAVMLDERGSQGTAAVPHIKESLFSVPRTIPDGASILLPLQYRPAFTKDKGCWLVVRIQPRIHIEEEERQIRAGFGK